MKKFKMSIMLFAALAAGISFTACSDADEYADTDTDNPSWVNGYNDSLAIAHPESIDGTTWVRGTGLKTNAYGEDVQGFVESMVFANDSVVVKMSQPALPSSWDTSNVSWTDDSNSESNKYEYAYSAVTGKFEVYKKVTDDKGKVSKSAIFTGIAVNGTQNVITVAHYGDSPVQTYLVMQ